MFIGVIYSGQNLFSLAKVTVGPCKSLFHFTKIQVANRENKLSLPKIPFQAKRWQIWKASYLRGRSLMVRSQDSQLMLCENYPQPGKGNCPSSFRPERVLFPPWRFNLRAYLAERRFRVRLHATHQFPCQNEKYLLSESETASVLSGVSGRTPSNLCTARQDMESTSTRRESRVEWIVEGGVIGGVIKVIRSCIQDDHIC